MLSTSLESARAWVSFAYQTWTGPTRPIPQAGLPDDGVVRQLGVGPFLYRALHRAGDSRANRYLAEYRHAATANLIRLRHGAVVRDAMEARGVTPVLLKGGAFLVRCVPGELGLRPMADLDLLVSSDQYAPAKAALEASGFRLIGGISRASDHASHAESFVSTNASLPIEIDLHRGLAHWPIATGLAERILATAVRVDAWRVPRLPDAVCLAALHRARHGFSWSLADLFELKHALHDLDAAGWDDLLDQASSSRLTGALWASYSQALWWLGAEPGDTERRAALAERLSAARRGALDRIAAPERQFEARSWWAGPLLRNLIVYPLALTTPGIAFAAAAMFLPLRAVEEWRIAAADGLGPAGRLRRLWSYSWRGRTASRRRRPVHVKQTGP